MSYRCCRGSLAEESYHGRGCSIAEQVFQADGASSLSDNLPTNLDSVASVFYCRFRRCGRRALAVLLEAVEVLCEVWSPPCEESENKLL